MTNLIRNLGQLAERIFTTSSYNEVIDVLCELRDSRSKVAIQFQGNTTAYCSKVTALNAKHGIFVLDSIQPATPTSTLQRGRVATITAGTNGQTVNLQCVYQEPMVAGQTTGYQLKIAGRLRIAESRRDQLERAFNPMLSRLFSTNSSIYGNKYAEYLEM